MLHATLDSKFQNKIFSICFLVTTHDTVLSSIDLKRHRGRLLGTKYQDSSWNYRKKTHLISVLEAILEYYYCDCALGTH